MNFKIKTLVIIAVLFFTACKKEKITTDPNVQFNTSTTTSSNNALYSGNTISASFTGTVINESNTPVANAKVTLLNNITYTDNKGYFIFKNVTVDQNRAFIKVEANGYFIGSRALNPIANRISNAKIKLLSRDLIKSFSNSSGSSVQLPGGASVIFNANDISLDDGTTYNGTVHVYGKYLNPTASDLGEIMPGDLSAINANGEAVRLESFGMMAIELEGSSGEKLNVASGKSVQIKMPLQLGQSSNAPASIPLWFFDETSGNWQEEGIAELIGNEYIGNVNHFTFWNCDYPYGLVDFRVKLSCQGIPANHVSIKMFGPNGEYYGTSYTDNLGELEDLLATDVHLIMKIYNDCYEEVYSQDLGIVTSEVDLGEIALCSVISTPTLITATLVNCNNEPIPYGRLLINTANNEQSITADYQGNISSIIYVCDPNFTVTAYDPNQNLISDNLPINANQLNELGAVSICNSIDEYVHYNIDESSYYINQYTENNVGAIVTPNGINPDSLTIFAFDNLNNNFEIRMMASEIGTFDSQVYNLNYDSTYVINNFTTTISTYGSFPGTYIEGTFSGSVEYGGLTSDVNGSFRAKRDN